VSAQKFNFVKGECGSTACEKGATFYYELIWEKEVSDDVFSPVDLTGFSAKMQVRKDVGSSLIIELSTANNRITFDSLNGKIILKISASDTSALVPGSYKYDLELTTPEGFVISFIYGSFDIIGRITA